MSDKAERHPGTPTRLALVVEDEPHIRELVALHLRREGLAVLEAPDGEVGLKEIQTQRLDLVVLDLMLPGIGGVALCRAIRQTPLNADAPVLMLTARRDETDKVLGLESGADDYLTKPFGIRELVARARALLRRPRQSAYDSSTVIARGHLRLDLGRRQALVRGESIDLTPHEFDVLHVLASHPGIVFSREALLERVWTSDTHVTVRSVDTLIKRLRQKIEADSRAPQLILTVWGAGYKFADV